MNVLQFLSAMGRKVMTVVTVIVLLAESWLFPSVPVNAESDTVNAQVDNSQTFNVNVDCRFTDHSGNYWISMYGEQGIIYDQYTGNRMFCIEPGPTMNEGIHTAVGSLQSYFGKDKGDQIQLIAHYGSISGNPIDYMAAQCLIWETGYGAVITQKGANGPAINAAKAVIATKVREYLNSGKQVKGTSRVYRSTGQDVMSIGTVIMDKQIEVSVQKASAQLHITQQDSSYSLSGAVYRVYEGNSTNGKVLCDLVTDQSGYASNTKLKVDQDVSHVTFLEIQAPQGYIRDDTPVTVTLTSDGKAHLHVSEMPLTKDISVSITKSSSNPGISGNNAMYDLSGAIFEAYYESSDGNRHVLGQLVTDGSGKASNTYTGIPLGVNEVKLKELSAPKGYYRSETEWKQTITDGKVHFDVRDTPAFGQVSLCIEKTAVEPVGNPAPLSGAQFTICYYDVPGGTSLFGLTPERTWVIETKQVDGTYVAKLDSSFLVGGDPLYTDEKGKIGIPLGVVTIEETKAPEGYVNSHVVTDGSMQTIMEENGTVVIVCTMNSDHSASLLMEEKYIYHENRAEGGLKIRKNDTDLGNMVQGNAESLSAVYRIINLNPYDVAMKVNGSIVSIASKDQPFDYEIVTDHNGLWQSDLSFLQTGTYRIEEIQSPTGYLVSSDRPAYVTAMDFTITAHQQTVILQQQLGDEIIRGGFQIRKQDRETGRPQGDCDLSTVFTMYNRSLHPVMVNGKLIDVDAPVDVDGDGDAYFTTDRNGLYESHDQLLPYGSYEIVEVQAPVGYQKTDHTSVSFTITQDHQMIDLCDAIKDEVVTGRLSIYKHYNAKPSSEWDDRPEQGAVFLAVLKKKLVEQFDDQMMDAYNALTSSSDHGFSNHEYSIITTDEYGIGTSGDLAYGTYVIGQIKGDPSTAIIEDRYEFTVSGTTQKTVDVFGREVILYEDQKPLFISATNDEQTYQIMIVKKDGDTGKTVTFNSASFMIGYDCDQDGRWTQADQNYSSTTSVAGNRIVNGFVTQKLGSHSYDVFRTYSGKDEKVEKGTFIVDTGNGEAEEAGTVVTPLHVSKGSYFIFEMDHDTKTVKEIPEGYVQAGSDTVEVNGVMFTQLHVSGNTHYQIISDSELMEKTYRVTKEVNNHRALGSLTLHKSILHTIHDTSLIDVMDCSIFGFSLQAKEDIIDPADGSVIVKAGENAKLLQDGTYRKTDVLYPDAGGILQIDGIPLGTYILSETVIPDGFVDQGWKREVTFEQMENDRSTQVYSTSMNLINRPTRISVSKISITDGKELPGASMKIKDLDGNIIDSWTSGNSPHIILGLSAGKTYILQEDLAPLGYVRASAIPFTVENAGTTQKITMVDEVVSVYKQDASFTGIKGAVLCVKDENGNVVDQWTGDGSGHRVNHLEEGKTYVLQEVQAPSGYVKAKDLTFTVHPEGKVQEEIMVDTQVFFHKTDEDGNLLSGAKMQAVDLNGNIIDSWTTDGTVRAMENLTSGETYIVQEIKAPDGYVKAEDQLFTVQQNQNMDVTMVDHQITVSKTDETGKPVIGASLQVADENGEVKDAWKSDGTAHPVSNLQAGKKYVLQELHSDHLKGYYLCKDQVIDLKDVQEDMEITMIDDTITVSLQKNDEEGNPVTDILLQLSDCDTKEVIPLPQDGKTGDKPIVLKGVLQAGHTYELAEMEWKEGYHPASSIRFEIPLYGTATPIVISMVDETTGISIIKQDEQGNLLAGARLQIIAAKLNEAGDYEPVLDENGNPKIVMCFDTVGKPADVSDHLKGGQAYIIQEIITPDGYETVKDTGFIATGTKQKPQSIVLVDQRKTYHVQVSKEDKDDHTLLSEAKIGLFHLDGTVVKDVHGESCIGETDETGMVTFDVLFDPDGCVVKEVQAPAGYVKTEQSVSVSYVNDSDETGKIDVVIVNEKIPATSDPFSLQTMLVLFGGSLLLLGAVLYFGSDRFRR